MGPPGGSRCLPEGEPSPQLGPPAPARCRLPPLSHPFALSGSEFREEAAMDVGAIGLVPGGRALERLGGLQRAGCGHSSSQPCGWGQHTGSLTPAGPVVGKTLPRGASLTLRPTPLPPTPCCVFNQRFRTCCLQGGTRYKGVVGSRSQTGPRGARICLEVSELADGTGTGAVGRGWRGHLQTPHLDQRGSEHT